MPAYANGQQMLLYRYSNTSVAYGFAGLCLPVNCARDFANAQFYNKQLSTYVDVVYMYIYSPDTAAQPGLTAGA